MKFSTNTVITVALIVGVVFGHTSAGFTSIKAQSITVPNNMTASNMTASNTSAGSAKMHLEEAIKALESGNKDAATHLTAAQQAISGESDQAKMHFDEGMKTFSAGNTNWAHAFEGR